MDMIKEFFYGLLKEFGEMVGKKPYDETKFTNIFGKLKKIGVGVGFSDDDVDRIVSWYVMEQF